MLQATKYADVLAKIGSKRSDFLSETKLKALTQAVNLTDFASNLKETIYQERIIKILMLDSSREFERVFQESFIDDYVEIVKSSPKSVKAFLRSFCSKD